MSACSPSMKNKIPRLIKIAVAAVAGLTVLYLGFNWTMSAVVHNKKEVMVPDLKGKSLTDAITVLSSLNLGLKKEGEETDQNLPVGTIIRQNPPAGLAVREGKVIKVTVSQGGVVLFVPNVTGQSARSAEIAIRSAGLTLGEESTKYSLLFKKDFVISQDPAAGTTAEKDAMVNLIISAGTPPADIRLMPDFTGKSIDDAKAWAAQNGMEAEVHEEAATEGSRPGTVLRQDPPADSDLSSTRKVVFIVASAGGAPAAPGARVFYYEIPQGSGDRQVRLTMIDETGEKEIFNGTRAPGSKLEIFINPQGTARVRVFINNIMVEQREIQ